MAELKQKKVKGEVKVDPEYEQKFYSQKITRLNKDKSEILPIKGEKNILITSALPYVNNIPHLGNIIGCVLPADVYARYCRLQGYNAIYVCGSDEFGTATEMAARKEGLTPREICDKYWKIHNQVYQWFDIDFDIFGRTSTEKHTKIAQDIFLDLHKNDYLTQQEMEQCFCTKCSIFLADRYVQGICPFCKYEKATGDQCDGCQKLLNPEQLIEGQCILCGTKPEIRKTKHCYLDLPKLQPKLEDWVKVASDEGNWTDVSKQITQDWLKKGLTERCITRDLKWGTPVPLEEYKEKVMYVWFDAPIGYISITANYTEHWEKWWKDPENVRSVEFMAKDNVTFHSIIFPASQIGTGQNWTKVNHLAATHYLNYESGKFSKRNGSGVFGDNAQETGIPVEVWRYYLLTNRPEHTDSVFSWKDFISKNNEELLPNLGNLCQRSTKFVESKFDSTVPEFKVEDFRNVDTEFLELVWIKYTEFIQYLENVQIKHAIKLAMEISSLGNNYMQAQAPWDKANFESGRSKVVIGILLNFLRLLSAIFEPFTPSLSAKINFTLGFEQRTEFDDKIYLNLSQKKSAVEAIIGLVKPGQKINKPLILFREYTKEEIEQWSLKFSGQQQKVEEGEKQLTAEEKKKLENKKKKQEKKEKKAQEKLQETGEGKNKEGAEQEEEKKSD